MKYFDLEGIPCRLTGPNAVPEIYRGNGKWENYTDSERFYTYGQEITEAACQKLAADFDASHASK